MCNNAIVFGQLRSTTPTRTHSLSLSGTFHPKAGQPISSRRIVSLSDENSLAAVPLARARRNNLIKQPTFCDFSWTDQKLHVRQSLKIITFLHNSRGQSIHPTDRNFLRCCSFLHNSFSPRFLYSNGRRY